MASIATWLDGEPADGGGQTRSFEQALVLIVAVEYLCRGLRVSDLPVALWAAAGTISAAALIVIATPWRRPGLVLLGATHAAVMTYEFPASGNHAYLELLFVALLVLIDPQRPEERRLFLRAGRWITCVVLVGSGLQKLAHGYYEAGQFLAYKVSNETYRPILAPLLPDAEVARLAGLGGQVGAGPYRVASPLFLTVSHGVYLAEIALGPLLVLHRTRLAALGAAILLLVAIEAGAREVFFGLVIVNGILLFGPASLHRAFVPLAASGLGALLLVRLGVLPGVIFN